MAQGGSDYTPPVNIVQDAFGFGLGFRGHVNVFLDPCHEMILERPLDKLVKQIRGEEFVDVGTWEALCKRLHDSISR